MAGAGFPWGLVPGMSAPESRKAWARLRFRVRADFGGQSGMGQGRRLSAVKGPHHPLQVLLLMMQPLLCVQGPL